MSYLDWMHQAVEEMMDAGISEDAAVDAADRFWDLGIDGID